MNRYLRVGGIPGIWDDRAQQVLIQFKYWDPRAAFHGFDKGLFNSDYQVRIYPDLTKRRLDVLSECRNILKTRNLSSRDVSCYTDINSNLELRANINVYGFNTTEEFEKRLVESHLNFIPGHASSFAAQQSFADRIVQPDWSAQLNDAWLAPPHKKRIHIRTIPQSERINWNADPLNIYCGRSDPVLGCSEFHNPFRITRATSREVAINKFKSSVLPKLTSKQISTIQNATTFACHCEPDENCHADLFLKVWFILNYWLLSYFFFLQLYNLWFIRNQGFAPPPYYTCNWLFA